MNVYIEDAGLRKNTRLLKRCIRLLPNEAHFDLHIASGRRVSLLSLALLAMRTKKIRSIELSQNIQKTSIPIIWMANAKNVFYFKAVVSKALRDKDIKKLEKLRGVVCVVDRSDADNEAFYTQHRNIVYQNREKDLISEVNYYALASNMPVSCCEFSSCLGKNLYIAPDGSASFCPKNIAESKMCNIFETENVFANEVFMGVLQASIAKRYACGDCTYKAKCNGFCALGDCADFKSAYTSAQEDCLR